MITFIFSLVNVAISVKNGLVFGSIAIVNVIYKFLYDHFMKIYLSCNRWKNMLFLGQGSKRFENQV